jgi:hypothetical protein
MSDNLQKMKEVFSLITESLTREEFVKAFKSLTDFVKGVEQRLTAKIDARLATLRNGTNGKDGRDGQQGPKGDRGERGATGRALFAPKGDAGKDGKDGSPDTPTEVRDKLETLKEDERLDKTAVRGIEDIEKEIKRVESIRVQSRGGGAKGFGLYINGVKKLLTAQTLNIVPGTGVTVSYNYANGRNDVTINATGSGSFSILAATGTVNDSNKVFTFVSAPVLVVVNGTAYRDGHGVTIVGTTATLDNVAGTSGDVYGIG